ncbi:MAG TPA: hypothetical protein VK588_02180, partial [Chitinophagaceae bacterium]|nr:hypothetical protein [Chitinophagaceae bacterium]
MPGIKTYKVVISSSELNTLYKYVNAPDSPAGNYLQDLNGLLGVTDDNGESNLQRIFQTYKTSIEFDALVDAGILSKNDNKYTVLTPEDLPLKVGTVLYLEYNKVNTISFLTEGLEVVSTDEVAFKASQLAQLESDINYTSLNFIVSEKFQEGGSKDMYPNVTVWIW